MPPSESQKLGKAPRGTLVELFLDAVDRFGARTAFQAFTDKGPTLSSTSYKEAYDTVKRVAGALNATGVRRGDRVAILSENRPEWALTDYASLCCGVSDVPVYPTLLTSQVAYILKDCDARIVFCSNASQRKKAIDACAEVGISPEIVVYEGTDVQGAVSWSDFLARGSGSEPSDEAFRSEARKATPDEVATLIYTSGTTGQPKGVMLTHQNLFSNVAAINELLTLGPDDNTMSFLPLSHVLQRTADYLYFSNGVTIAYAHDNLTIASDLRIVQPTIAVSVPRLYEKVYNKIMEAEGLKARIVQWADEVGSAWAMEKLEGRQPTLATRIAHGIADRLVYKKVREAVGGRLRFFVSGGAPLEPAIARFFYAAGVTILEGYGLTETSPVTNLNTPEHFKIGSVGRAVPWTEIHIAEDGEILIRGPQVMKGYYNLPDETAKVIDADGWFATGDIGEIDAEGYLRITDRKKDLIVTAGGKNIAPQPIENRLKTNRFVEQVVMVGDKRKFVALLVVPSFTNLEAWAKQQGISFSGKSELLSNGQVHSLLQKEILWGLNDLPTYERPKKLALLEDEFTVENGTLTPSLKVKRRVVQERLKPVIDAFYDDANSDSWVLVATDHGAAASA